MGKEEPSHVFPHVVEDASRRSEHYKTMLDKTRTNFLSFPAQQKALEAKIKGLKEYLVMDVKEV